MDVLDYTAQQGIEVPILTPTRLRGDLSESRLSIFSKRVRDLCVFARQNLCSDPPFSHIDVLSCGNVMIYFNQVLQRQVMATLHYALDPGGLMVLGLSEATRDVGDLFQATDQKYELHRKTGTAPLNLELYRTYRTLPVPSACRTGLQNMCYQTLDESVPLLLTFLT